MLIYMDILNRLKDAGYSTYRLRVDRCLTESTLTSIRQGRPISTQTVDTLCRLLDCQPGDILVYCPDSSQGEDA